LATSTVSSHLSILSETGFIVEEKDGKWVNYRINPHPDDPVAGALGSLLYGVLNDLNEIASDRRRVGVVDRVAICR
jgi:DNA-binding transcriptional ArsR family regulator